MIVCGLVRSPKDLDERYCAAWGSLQKEWEERHCAKSVTSSVLAAAKESLANRDTVRASRLGQRETVERYLLPAAIPAV